MANDTTQEIFPKKIFTHGLPVKVVNKWPHCLIITSPLPSKPVEQVAFILKSRDHGWASSDNFDNIYVGSWTWFEAMILRPVSGGDDWNSLYWENRDIASESSVSSALAELAGLREPPPKEQATLCFVTNPKNPPSHSWLIQRNRRAKSDPKEHTVIWDKVKKESRTERLGWEFDADTGAGSGVGFVNSLREGDRIAIIACAMQSGAINYVSEAQIKVEFTREITGKTLATTETQAEATARYSPNKWRSFWSSVKASVKRAACLGCVGAQPLHA